MSIENNVIVDLLAYQQEHVTELCDWLTHQWPEWYGPGGFGSARFDVESSADLESLPIGLVAVIDSKLVGYISLKSEPITGYEAVGPWAGAAIVRPAYRNRGIGTLLVHHLGHEAKRLGFSSLYSGNRTVSGMMARNGWSLIGSVLHNQEQLSVFQKSL